MVDSFPDFKLKLSAVVYIILKDDFTNFDQNSSAIALLEQGTGNREQGTVRSERVSGFKNVLTVMRSAISGEMRVSNCSNS
jgi:hypothetical protein